MFDAAAPKFGLPKSLWVPIAAQSVANIEAFVGPVIRRVMNGSSGRESAVLVVTAHRPTVSASDAALWPSNLAQLARERLHPEKQVWVHVDYDAYRTCYIGFGMPAIPPDHFLDHVQNRIATRMRDYQHSYLRLCPVHRSVNTNAGHRTGGEGMEKEFLAASPPTKRTNRIIYADPFDLTKMLNIAPGTQILEGVRMTQKLFFN